MIEQQALLALELRHVEGILYHQEDVHILGLRLRGDERAGGGKGDTSDFDGAGQSRNERTSPMGPIPSALRS